MLGSNLDTAYVAHTRELYDIFECEPDLRRGDVYTTTPFFYFFCGEEEQMRWIVHLHVYQKTRLHHQQIHNLLIATIF